MTGIKVEKSCQNGVVGVAGRDKHTTAVLAAISGVEVGAFGNQSTQKAFVVVPTRLVKKKPL